MARRLSGHKPLSVPNLHIVHRRIYAWPGLNELTYSGQVTHICVSELSSIGSDNGLAPGRRQAIIWTNAGILLIRTPGTHFSEILSELHTIWLRKCTSKCRLRNGGNFVSASMCLLALRQSHHYPSASEATLINLVWIHTHPRRPITLQQQNKAQQTRVHIPWDILPIRWCTAMGISVSWDFLHWKMY